MKAQNLAPLAESTLTLRDSASYGPHPLRLHFLIGVSFPRSAAAQRGALREARVGRVGGVQVTDELQRELMRTAGVPPHEMGAALHCLRTATAR